MSTDGCVAGARATPEDVLAGRARWCVVEGDALDVLPTLPAGSTNALVTDPPAGIAFMGAEWDRDKGGRTRCAFAASPEGASHLEKRKSAMRKPPVTSEPVTAAPDPVLVHPHGPLFARCEAVR